MSHALRAQSLVNAIHVLMASLSEIISALNVSQTNTSMVTLVRTVGSDAYDVTAAQTSVLSARLIQTWQQMEFVSAEMEHSLMV